MTRSAYSLRTLLISIAATALDHAHANSTVVGVHVAHDGKVFYVALCTGAMESGGDEFDSEVAAAADLSLESRRGRNR